MTGVWECLRLLLRTSWTSVVGWPVALGVLLWSAAASILDMYPDEARRTLYAEAAASSVATRVFQGRGYDLTLPGGIFAQEMGIIVLTLFPLVAVFLAIQLTRSLEDRNYLDIITAGIVGRFAPVAAGMLACCVSALLTGLLGAVILIATGYPQAGSIWYAASLVVFMIFASAVGLLAGQLFRNAREAQYLAIAVILGCYLLRGYIDVKSVDATWSNPISWFAETLPFSASPQAWPFAAYIVAACSIWAAALWVAAHRDLGGGVFPPQPGPAEASPRLSSPAALIFRLTREAGIAFMIGGGATAFVFGLFAKEMASSGLDARLVLLMQVNALFACAVAVQTAQLVVSEERAGRAARVLSAPVGRSKWMLAAGLVVGGWALMMLAWTGLVSGAGLALSLEDASQVGDAVLDTLAFAPAALLVTALACALGAVHPRLAVAAWFVVVWSAVVTLRADMLQLGETSRRLSPLEWMGKVPLEDWAGTAALAMSVIAVVAFALSLLLFRRRDLVAG